MNFKIIKNDNFFKIYLKKKKNLRKLNINFCGRSGSFFLHRLLDGHPNIITFHPEYDIYIYQNLKTFFNNRELIYNLPSFLRSVLKKDFVAHMNIWGATELNLNIDLICDEIFEILKNTDIKDYNFDLLIDIFFIAHARINIDYLDSEDPFVLLQTHVPFDNKNEQFYFQNVNIFKFLIMMRDPVKSIDSHYYHHLEENIILPKETLFLKLLNLFNESVKIITNKKFKNKIYVIKFEDLHLRSKETMNKICKQLNINFHEILLCETNLSKNTKSIKKKTGEIIHNFRKIILPEKINYLNSIQIKIIENKFDDIFKLFNYEKRNKSRTSNLYLAIFYLLKTKKEYLIENINNLLNIKFCNSMILKLFKIKKYF